MEIVLASASPRRLELLKQIGVSFKVIPSQVDESIYTDVSPEELVKKLAYEKALDIAEKLVGDCLVIGADTIVVKNGILGKPKDEKQAFDMLKSLCGEWHEVITGIAVVRSGGGNAIAEMEITRVKMRDYSESTIKSYVETGEPMDKAGAYGIQGMGAVLVQKIEGCYFNVVGLPIARLCTMLKSYGVNVL